MVGIIIGTIVTVWAGILIVKNYKAQSVLFFAGIVLMAIAVLMGKTIFGDEDSTGFVWFDIFKYIENVFSNRAAKLGLIIMSVGGFSRYMDKIGASKALVKLGIKPLGVLKSPYIVLSIGYIISQILNIFIPSAAGLGVLLMATLFPILVGLGVSRAAAAAMIGTSAALDLGPGSSNAVLASKNSGLDVSVYFAHYQIPVAIFVVIVVAILHYFVQKWFDERQGHVVKRQDDILSESKDNMPPMIYAILPIIPLFFILLFSKLLISSIKMPVVTAMLISIFISMIFEYIRYRDAQKVFKSLQVFFDGMGVTFATVVTLIVAGETFAQGLKSIGAIDSLINGAQNLGFGAYSMILVMTGLIVLSSLVTGSGNAAFFSFAALAKSVVSNYSIAPVLMLLPMQLAAGIGRSFSPISGVIIAISGISEVSPVELVKRTSIPMIGALLISIITNFLLF